MTTYKDNFEESRYFHIMIRGIAKQIIFEDNFDNQYFLNLLKEYSFKHNIKVICYCLMYNHAHIECQDFDENISQFMSDLCATYARYFNKKYERCGSLFQRPYKKKIINNEAYLMQVFHYIMRNPEKDGICPYRDYYWSSYKFINSQNHFTDTEIILDILGGESLDSYLSTAIEEDKVQLIDNFCKDKTSDFLAKKFITSKFNIKTASEIKSFNKEDRREAILLLKNYGLSIRQIERLTGVSRGICQNIL